MPSVFDLASGHKTIDCPREMPGYEDWRHDLPSPVWAQIGRDCYASNQGHVVIWSVHSSSGQGTLYWGAEAAEIRQRFAQSAHTRGTSDVPGETATGDT